MQQGAKLVGTINVENPAQQGSGAAISGDGNTALVGGYFNNSNIGGAWVFSRSGGTWSEDTKLLGSGATGAAEQGYATALSNDGNVAVISGVADNAGPGHSGTGAVWVFVRTSGVWDSGTKFVGSTADQDTGFGTSVAVSADGQTIIVGGPGINNFQGAAWVFISDGAGGWTEQAKLVGSGVLGSFATQGVSVAISADGNTVIIGGNNDNSSVGAAWVFTRSGTTWTERQKLVASNSIGQSFQGQSVAISGDGNTAAVGGFGDGLTVNTGATWIYTRSGNTWSQQAKLIGSGAVGAAAQGIAVALSNDGNTAIASGDIDNSSDGAVWVFTRSGGNWTQQGDKLSGADISGHPVQGFRVGLSADGNTAIWGGTQDNSQSGAAWVFAQTPIINSVTPTEGSRFGGTNVTITGIGFTGTTAVTFGGNAASNVTVVDPKTITATTPGSGADGAVDVVVTNAIGSGTAGNAFRYKEPSSTTLGSSANPAVFGQNVTFTANVNGGPVSGTVTFKDGTTTLGTAPLSGATATLDTAALAVGSHSITAVYNGSNLFLTSNSNTVIQVVNAAATATALNAAPNPSTFGQSVTLTATVAATAPGSGTPTGTVNFKEGAITLGSAPLSSGTAAFSTAALAGGVHTITATYTGDANFNPSTSSSVMQTVNKAATTTALAASASQVTTGQLVTFTATVTGTGATGSVTFKDGAATIGSSAVAGGAAGFSTSSLAAGSHSITAVYGGDGNFNGSTSNAKSVTVTSGNTTTTLNVAPNPSVVNQSVTLTATVSAQSGSPTGNVTFKDGTASLGGSALASGTATLNTSALAAGGHNLTAAYDGNASFTASSSAPVLQNVVLSCADNFANATPLTGMSGSASGSNAAASGESGEPNHAGNSTPLNSVWCSWTAPASGPVTFDTTGSGFDTTLAAYTGTSVNALSLVAANDNIGGGNNQSRITFNAAGGVAYAIAVDGAGAATGNYVLTWSQGPAQPSLFSAVLPTSRSVTVGATATAFATLINSGAAAATGCTLALPVGFPAAFFFQTTDAANVPNGTQGAPVDIPANKSQSFVFGVTPATALAAAEAAIVFNCSNAGPAPVVPGLNTLSLSASTTPTPDLIAIGSTPTNDGIVTVPTNGQFGFFAAAAINIGAADAITATVDDNGRSLPLTITLCRTDQTTGACINPATPASSTTSTLATNEISTYTIFVQSSGAVAFDPANNRLFLRFKTGDGVTRGSTSVAVRTQ